MRGRRRGLSLRSRAAGGLLVATTLLMIAEGAARIVGPRIPAWQGGDRGGVIMTGHPTRLWGMNSGVRKNVTTTATVNEDGIRGPMPTLPRPEGQERVMILGDSTFFGHGIDDDKTIVVRVVAHLQEQGITLDGVNGGIPGYSTEQTRMFMDEQGWAYDPSLLVIGNLWSDNNFDHFRDADLLRTREALAHNPMARLALYQVLAGAIDRMKGGDGAHIVTWTRDSEWPPYGVRRVSLDRYFANLDHLVRTAAERGIGAALLSPCNLRMAGNTEAHDPAWAPYFEAQRRIAAHHGIPVIPSAPQLIAKAEEVGAEALYIDEMHPSALGADTYAQAIADGLIDAGWPARALVGQTTPAAIGDLEDVAPDGRSSEVNERSPQANLFPNTIPSNVPPPRAQ